MPVMPRPSRSLRALLERAFRLVALLAWVGQLAVVGAPLVEASAGTQRGPHVEAHTNPLHHAHNPDLCPACAALALVGRPEPARAPIAESARAYHEPPTAHVAGASDHDSPAARPRAPPVCEADLRSRMEIDSHTTTNDAFRILAVRAHAERRGLGERAAA
jgi:hypothetical protein